jgi:DNA-binding CsgD family transcriptional regulator
LNLVKLTRFSAPISTIPLKALGQPVCPSQRPGRRFFAGIAMWLVATSAVPGNLPFRLDEGEYVLGRTKKAQIVIADAAISRRHARFVCTRNGLTIEDLNSSNGTFVNELPITGQQQLQVGDRVRLGMVTCLISRSPLLIHAVAEDESTYQVPLPPSDTTQIEGFTRAQQAIIPHLLEGRSETEIARILGKSRHTIHAHIRAMFERAEVHSREELIVRLVKNP